MSDFQTDPREGVIFNYATIAAIRALGVTTPSPPDTVLVTAEQIGTGDGATVEFPPQIGGGEVIALANTDIIPSTLVVTDGSVVGTDDGAGAITGAGIVTGTIDYTLGEIFVEFSTAPVAFAPVTVNYRFQPATTPTAGQMTDVQILRAIRLVSLRINQLTDQFFQPVKGGWTISGTNTRRLTTPNYDKIVLLDDLEFVGTNEFGDPLSNLSFFEVDRQSWTVIRDRFVDLRGSTFVQPLRSRFTQVEAAQFLSAIGLRKRPRFTEGRNNWRFTGTFGWLDPVLAPVLEMEIQGPVLLDGTSIVVDDVTGLLVGDSIISDDNVHAIVTAIDTGTDTITIDPATAAIPEFQDPPTNSVRTTIFRHGRVPELIQQVATEMVLEFHRFTFGSAEQRAAAIQGLLIEERTDNYRYKLAAPSGGRNTTSLGSSGRTEWDRILVEFTAPVRGLEWV